MTKHNHYEKKLKYKSIEKMREEKFKVKSKIKSKKFSKAKNLSIEDMAYIESVFEEEE